MQKQPCSSPLLVICRLLVLGESKLLSIRYFHLRLRILGWGDLQLSHLKRWALSAAIHHHKKCLSLMVGLLVFLVKLSRPSLKHYELEVQVLIRRPSSAPALTLDLVL